MECGACDREAVKLRRCTSGRIVGACWRHLYHLEQWLVEDNFHFDSLDPEEQEEARKLVQEEMEQR
jgi:hypothetical protein